MTAISKVGFINPYVFPILNTETLKKVREKIRSKSKANQLENIKLIVMRENDINEDDFTSKVRIRENVNARFIFYHLARKYTGASLKSLGRLTGYRDHSSVLHGIGVMDDLITTNSKDIMPILKASEAAVRDIFGLTESEPI